MWQAVRNWGEQKWRGCWQVTPYNARYDRFLLWLYFIFLTIGILAVSSAGVEKSADPMYYPIHQLIYVAVALGVFILCCQLSSQFWEKSWRYLLMLAALSALATQIFGKEVNGAKRWLDLGIVSFQSAELIKFVMICYFASFLSRRQNLVRGSQISSVYPIIVCALAGIILVFWQNDFGSTVLIFILLLAMLLLARVSLIQFLVLGCLGGIALALVALFAGTHRKERLLSFFTPFADFYNGGYQAGNSLMALGQGEWLGVGFGNSVQKLGHLPEAHTDFIFAVLGEEFGWLGVSTLILLYGLFFFRVCKIIYQTLHLERRFQGYFVCGLGLWIFGQAIANMAVAISLIPNKGLTLPFISYGGTSLLMSSAALAIILRIDYENRELSAGNIKVKPTEA